MPTWLKALLVSAALYLPLAMCASQVDRAMAEKGDFQPPIIPENGPPLDLMFDLMEWTALEMRLPLPYRLPNVVMTERCIIHRIWHPEDECPTGIGLAAGYSESKVWLQVDWRPNNIYDLSLLVHELAHHIQAHALVPVLPCREEALERPAYAAQFAFIRQMGSDPWMILGLSPDDIQRLTTCPR